MRSHVHFIFIFLYLRVFFADCWPKNDLNANVSTSVKTDTLNSTKPNSEPASPSNRCMRKCCKLNEIYHWKNNTCLPDLNNELKNANWSTRFKEYEIIDDSRCLKTAVILNDSDIGDQFDHFSNGSIYSYAFNKTIYFHLYCMDYLMDDRTIRPVICVDETFGPLPEEESDGSIFILYSSGLGVSDIFLIITAALYLATPQLRRKVHDKCFLCHLLSLIIGFSSLIGIQNINIEVQGCVFLGESIILIVGCSGPLSCASQSP